jgi:hypothetical protein
MNTITITDRIRHYLNPLHVYCRLRPIIGKHYARLLSLRYQTLYNLI